MSYGKLMGDRVLVKQDEAPKQIGLIVIPENMENTEMAVHGIVLAVGPGRLEERSTPIMVHGNPHPGSATFCRIPMTVKVGDGVLFNKYAATEVYHDKEKLMLIRETDVMIIDDDAVEAPTEPGGVNDQED